MCAVLILISSCILQFAITQSEMNFWSKQSGAAMRKMLKCRWDSEKKKKKLGSLSGKLAPNEEIICWLISCAIFWCDFDSSSCRPVHKQEVEYETMLKAEQWLTLHSLLSHNLSQHWNDNSVSAVCREWSAKKERERDEKQDATWMIHARINF